MKRFSSALALAACVAAGAAPSLAQDNSRTLADIRQELTVLHVEMQKLTRELSTTGTPGVNVAGSSVLDRVAAMEGELQRLTNQTEELQNRVNRVATDGANQIGDLAFRLCEVEPNCDPANQPVTKILGGAEGAKPVNSPGVATQTTPSTEMAVGEQSDFQAAAKALEAGDYQDAARKFSDFNLAYPGSPLAAEADLNRGKALESMGDTREAARAYLASFTADTAGAVAPDALFKLGAALGRLGQREQACITLGEVGVRFPGNAAVSSAQNEMATLGCS